jgi:hypothetical protein
MGGFWGSLKDYLAGGHGPRPLEERADYTHDYSIWVQLVKDYFKWFGWSEIADRSIEKRAKSKPPHAKPAYGAPTEGHTSKKQEKSKSAPLLRRAGLKTVGMRHPKAFSELRRGHPAIGTGIDTWLKPGVRHKIHYTYHDLFRKLLTELRFVDKSDVNALKVIKKHFYETEDEYRKEVFSV